MIQFPVSLAAVCITVPLMAAAIGRQNNLAGIICRLGRDFIRSRFGVLAYKVLGRLWTDADKVPTLSKVITPEVGEVTVVRTAKSTGERLTVLEPLRLQTGAPAKGEPTIVVDSKVRYQAFLGFGGSFTESAAGVFRQVSEENQAQIIRAYFNEDDGLGYRLGRLHMNSCDFSTGHWACAETPGDTKLEDFSIDRYKAEIIPMLRRAVAAAGCPLKLIFSPWSPPAWMKDNGKMHAGKLLPEFARVWAEHYVRFAEAFAAINLPFWGLTVENEPDNAGAPWETCAYSAEDERDFVRDHLGPTLEAKGLDLKLMVWDHNRDDMFYRAHTILSDPAAAKYVWGVAYHWYGDPRHEFWPDLNGQVLPDNLQRVHDAWPDKHIVMSECCQEMGPRIGNWALGERYAEGIIRDLNNWLEVWIDWNLVLDAWGGPNHSNNKCSAPIIADISRNRILYLSSFYYIGHFSRYIKPGARRILSAANRDALEVTAFANPDGSIAVVVLNQSGRCIDFCLQCDGSTVKAASPARSITTFLVAPPLRPPES